MSPFSAVVDDDDDEAVPLPVPAFDDVGLNGS